MDVQGAPARRAHGVGLDAERCESIKKNDVVQQNAILWSLFFQMDGVYPNRWLANVAEKMVSPPIDRRLDFIGKVGVVYR